MQRQTQGTNQAQNQIIRAQSSHCILRLNINNIKRPYHTITATSSIIMRPISTSSMLAAAVLLSHCCHWTVITAIAEEQPTCTSTGDGECTDDDNINIILPAAAAAAAAAASSDTNTNTKPDTNTNTANNANANQCQLYLAPSTLPHAGLGLYAGGTSPIPPHQSISTHRDLVLPILDPYKAHPHRGQQRFPSYLAYAHPKRPGALATELHNDSGPSRAFPTVPQVLWDMDTGFNAADGVKFYWEDVALNDLVDLDPPTDNEEGGVEDVWEEPMNAFVPGLSMLVNHHCELNNMDRLYSEDDSEDDDEEESDGAGIEYVALKSIRAGMELVSQARTFNCNTLYIDSMLCIPYVLHPQLTHNHNVLSFLQTIQHSSLTMAQNMTNRMISNYPTWNDKKRERTTFNIDKNTDTSMALILNGIVSINVNYTNFRINCPRKRPRGNDSRLDLQKTVSRLQQQHHHHRGVDRRNNNGHFPNTERIPTWNLMKMMMMGLIIKM